MNTLANAYVAALQSAARDTVVMVPVRDALETAGIISAIFLAVVVLALMLIFLTIAFKLRNLESEVRGLVKKLNRRLGPVMERARSVAENVDYVSHVVRNDVEEVAESVKRIRVRLDEASDRMEERVEEFNALMEVVQSEAEEVFLDTAATVRGVRAGSRKLGDRSPAVEEEEDEEEDD